MTASVRRTSTVRALALSVLVLSAAVLAAGAQQARACSCAQPDPRSALAAADGAFTGRLVSRREDGNQAILVFDVDRTLKGSMGDRVEVRTASSSAACGIETPIGTRVGLVLERRDGAWHGHLCLQFSPEDLLAAAKPLPAPNGKGPVAFFVGGRFGHARLIALDRQGRTLAYGAGSGTSNLLTACPGGRRLVEVAAAGGGWKLAVREQRTLRFVRTRPLALSSGLIPSGITCEDVKGSRVLVLGRSGDDTARAQLVRLGPSGRTVLWSGTAVSAAVNGSSAYLATGKRGTGLVTIDLETGVRASLGRIPALLGPLAASPDGALLAGVAYSAPEPGAQPSRMVVIDLRHRPVRVRTATLGRPNVSGQTIWLADDAVALFPAGDTDVVRVYDVALRLRDRFSGWSARNAVKVGALVYGVDWDGRLLRAALPSGPVSTARRLPSPVAYALAAA